MELHQTICVLIKQKKLTKREFARLLIQKEVQSKRTGNVLSEKIIYSYLIGKTTIGAELIPHIADILDISEQELFDNSEKKRLKLLKYILINANEVEQKTALALLEDKTNSQTYGFPTDYQLKLIADLLPYAPTLAVDKFVQILNKYKKLFLEVENEG